MFCQCCQTKEYDYNDKKNSVFSTRCLTILRHIFENGEIRRLRPPRTPRSNQCKDGQQMQRGLFSYYSVDFFQKERDQSTAIKCFHCPLKLLQHLKVSRKTRRIGLTAIDEIVPFEVETDASEVAIAATLNQAGYPVAFFSGCYKDLKSDILHSRKRHRR